MGALLISELRQNSFTAFVSVFFKEAR